MVLAYVCLAVYLVSLVALGETLQAAERVYDRPVVLRYLQMGSAVTLIPLAAAAFPAPCLRHCAAFLRLLSLPSLPLAIFVNGGGILYAFSLTGTSVGISTALSRIRPVFIFCLSVLLGLSRFTWWGLVAVGLALGGVTLLILSSLPGVVHGRSLAVEAATTCLGVALTVGSAFVWAGTDVYTQHLADHRFGLAHTTWRRPQLAPIVQMCALQGLLGAWTLLVCWVAIPLAAFFEGDPLLPSRDSLPPLATWPIIAASCASLVATNLSLSIAIACSSAFFMSIASLLSIPMAFAVDYWLHDTVPSALEAAGALCVVMAFLVLSLCAAPQRERRAAASDDTWEPTRVGGLAASPFDRETAGSSGLAAAEVKLLAPDACAGSSPAGGAA